MEDLKGVFLTARMERLENTGKIKYNFFRGEGIKKRKEKERKTFPYYPIKEI